MPGRFFEKADAEKARDGLRLLCVTAVSTALFVVLTLCLQVPVFENYYLCLGYVVMGVCLYSFGTLSGTFVGVVGTALYCLLISGLRGMPGWAAGNLVIGLVVGPTFKLTKRMGKPLLGAVLNFLAIAASTALKILILKSLVECVLYGQPMAVRMGKNVFAFVADVFVLELSLPICAALDKPVGRLLRSRRLPPANPSRT